MGNEQLYYTNNNFAYRIDDEGRVIDNFLGAEIGISKRKKDEILADYRALSDENIALKADLGKIKIAIKANLAVMPDELRAYVEEPPSVESLQGEISELKGMVEMLLKRDERRGGNDAKGANNSGSVPAVGSKPADPAGGGKKAGPNGAKPEQS